MRKFLTFVFIVSVLGFTACNSNKTSDEDIDSLNEAAADSLLNEALVDSLDTAALDSVSADTLK